MGNTIGTLFRFTSFGESHGVMIGGVIDGCPAGIAVDYELISSELSRRKGGAYVFSTKRVEDDKVEFFSGIFEGKTLGTPIAFGIRNNNVRSQDYKSIKNIYRPSHADYGYDVKYGIRDYRGGGRASARETAVRVVAGAFAKMILRQEKIDCMGYVSEIAGIKANVLNADFKRDMLKGSVLQMPDVFAENKVMEKLKKLEKKGDTAGGIITVICKNVPAGLGEPVFDKLEADISKAVLSIPAAKGIEFGKGFGFANMTGTEANDIFVNRGGKITTKTNNNGGIIGGISTGADIVFNVVFKPVSTVFVEQTTVDSAGREVSYIPHGRHDVTVLPRAVVVVESMTAIVLADMLLRQKAMK